MTNQPWILIGRTDAEAVTPVFWSSDANSWLIGKVLDAGKYWGQENRASENVVTRWHHQCNEHELGQTLGDDEGQRGLACCGPWGHKELDMTRWLNSNNDNLISRWKIWVSRSLHHLPREKVMWWQVPDKAWFYHSSLDSLVQPCNYYITQLLSDAKHPCMWMLCDGLYRHEKEKNEREC